MSSVVSKSVDPYLIRRKADFQAFTVNPNDFKSLDGIIGGMDHNQPDYEESPTKRAARTEIIGAYRLLSGNFSIPTDRSLWSLCFSSQEIQQFVNSKLIDPSQYRGINRDRGLVDKLKLQQPTAKFYRGEWRTVVQELNSVPACIYFDSTQEIENRELQEEIACTMRLCPKETLLAVNVIVQNPQRGNHRLLDTKFGRFLANRFDGAYLNTWDLEGSAYEYKTNRTQMKTFLFWRLA